MKKTILCALALCACIGAFAQAQLQTRKYRISDFREKTLQVVMTDNDFLDAALKNECRNLWHISPWEICSREQFEERKTSEDYYFLSVVDAAFRKDLEPGIKLLAIYKGGQTKTGVGDMFKVISIPFSSADNPDGDELDVLPALLTILQTEIEYYIKGSRRPSRIIHAGLNNSLKKLNGRVCIDEDDLAFKINDSMKAIYREDRIDIVERGVSAQKIGDRSADTFAGFLVAPDAPGHGNVCYVMIIDCSSHELCHIGRHSLGGGQAAGFTKSDINRIKGRIVINP